MVEEKIRMYKLLDNRNRFKFGMFYFYGNKIKNMFVSYDGVYDRDQKIYIVSSYSLYPELDFEEEFEKKRDAIEFVRKDAIDLSMLLLEGGFRKDIRENAMRLSQLVSGNNSLGKRKGGVYE